MISFALAKCSNGDAMKLTLVAALAIMSGNQGFDKVTLL